MAGRSQGDEPNMLYKSYFNDSTLSDVTLKFSDGTTVHAHRIILCRRSEYFAKLLTSGFMESEFKEIELHDDEPSAVLAMLRYFYDLPYAGKEAHWHDRVNMLPHAQAYTVAAKYGVQSLKQITYNSLMSFFYDDMVNPDFVPIIREIMTGTPGSDRMARKLVIDTCVANLPMLSKDEKFRAVLKDVGELGAAIIAELVGMYERGSCNNPRHRLEGEK